MTDSPAEPQSQQPNTDLPSSDNVQGDKVMGNKIDGDQITADIDSSQAVAIGRGATAINYGLTIEQVQHLFTDWRAAEQATVWTGHNPYVGLNAFQENDAEYFFGRETLVDDLLTRVQTSTFITIAGPSGSGKSSVARAGLFHALRTGRIDRSNEWQLAAMQPRGNPIEQLADAIARLTKLTETKTQLLDAAIDNPLALHEQTELILSDAPRQRLVLLVDQFEETYTQTKDDAIRAAFINLLTSTASVENGRTIIVLALRSDFISSCASFPALRELMSEQFMLVGAMDPPELAKAIALPAIKVGAEIDSALVSRILDDMKGEPGALPLMSFALRDLFEAGKTQAGQPMDITLQEYLDRGGIDKALQRHADEVFADFTPQQQKLAEGIFTRLIEVGQGRVDTRRTATFTELVPAGTETNQVAAVVQTLAQEGVRLITTDSIENATGIGQPENSGTTVTLAHEKLIEAWPRLHTLVNENRTLIDLQNQINTDAQAWQTSKDTGFLYRGGRLIQVEEKLERLQPSLDMLSGYTVISRPSRMVWR